MLFILSLQSVQLLYQVKKGMGIVTDTEAVKTDSNDRPEAAVTIGDCGQILPGQPWGFCESDGTPDVHPHHPEDLDLDWCYQHLKSSLLLFLFRYLASNFTKILEIVTDIKESGNVYYKQGDHVTATRKYRKCCKYIKLLRDTMGQTDDDEEKLYVSL